jgi:hypothetical protein
MNKIALLFGILLVGLGLYGYLGSTPKTETPTAEAKAVETNGAAKVEGKRSLTALIPAIFGLALGICGALALNTAWRKDSMHFAAFVALLGVVLGGWQLFRKLPALFRGDADLNQRAILFTGLLVLCCAIYLVLSVRSFLAARQAIGEKSV